MKLTYILPIVKLIFKFTSITIKVVLPFTSQIFHRTTAYLRLAGISVSICSNPCLKQGQPEHGAQVAFENQQQENFTTL